MKIDERFILHRYKSTSFAGQACVLMVGGIWAWHYFAEGQFRLDLFVVIAVTALTKLGFMAWYHFKD